MKTSIPVHWLSKDARRRIIEIMLSTRSIHQLSRELGLSATAVRKYVSGETHPSDQTMIKVFEIVAPYEREQIYKVVIDDLTDAILYLSNHIEEETLKEYLKKRIKEVMNRIEQG